MNPRVVAMQNGFLVLGLAALLLLGSRAVAVGIAFVLLLFAVGMAWSYGRMRRRDSPYAGLPMEEWERPGRRGGETLVIGSTAVAVALPIALAATELITDGHLVGSPSRVAGSILLAPIGTLLMVVVASSLVDWWFIHPRIDGLVCEPPCLAPDHERWRGVTQIWFVHRWLAAGAVILGLGLFLYALLGVALYVGVDAALTTKLDEGQRKTLALVAGLIGGGLVLEATRRLTGVLDAVAGEYIRDLKIITRLGLNPEIALGDYVFVRGDGFQHDGYLLDVSFEGISIVPRSRIIASSRRAALKGDRVRTAQLGAAQEVKQSPNAGPWCSPEGCRFMNGKYCFRAQNLAQARASRS